MVLLKSLSNSRAFTLSEVLVTVAIIAALSAIGLPQYNRYRIRARRSEAYGAVSTIVKVQKAVYINRGSYGAYDGFLPAVSSRNEVRIGEELVFGACPLGDCGPYNYNLAINGTYYIAQRRVDDAVNGLWPTGVNWVLPTDFDRFVIRAQGDIFDDPAPRQGDVVFYDSGTDITRLYCDDEKGEPVHASCQW